MSALIDLNKEPLLTIVIFQQFIPKTIPWNQSAIILDSQSGREISQNAYILTNNEQHLGWIKVKMATEDQRKEKESYKRKRTHNCCRLLWVNWEAVSRTVIRKIDHNLKNSITLDSNKEDFVK